VEIRATTRRLGLHHDASVGMVANMKTLCALLVTTLAIAGCSSDGGDSSTGSSSSGGNTADLDAKNAFWLGNKAGKSLILYTYEGSATVLMDIRSAPKDGTEGQYSGSRTGTAEAGYKLDLECTNPGQGPCVMFGDTMKLDCTITTDQLVCGATVFDSVTADQISQ
jgi:hypothetical protein